MKENIYKQLQKKDKLFEDYKIKGKNLWSNYNKNLN